MGWIHSLTCTFIKDDLSFDVSFQVSSKCIIKDQIPKAEHASTNTEQNLHNRVKNGQRAIAIENDPWARLVWGPLQHGETTHAWLVASL